MPYRLEMAILGLMMRRTGLKPHLFGPFMARLKSCPYRQPSPQICGPARRMMFLREKLLVRARLNRAVDEQKKDWSVSVAMAHPARNADPLAILASSRVFFVTTKTSMGLRLLQSERNAMLLVDVLRSNVAAGKFALHEFVIMPDHVHLLMTLPVEMTIEKAMQLIKGGFSYRLKKELGYQGEVWQRGFSEARIDDARSFIQHREYIVQNPVKAGLAETAEQYPYGYTFLTKKKAQGIRSKSLLDRGIREG
jgi:putative transposase